MRLSIELTQEQHSRLKAAAALHGQSIKNYVLDRTLPPGPDGDLSEDEALRQLEALLEPRIEAARRGEISSRSVRDIAEDVKRNHSDAAL